MALTLKSLWDQRFTENKEAVPKFTYLGAAAKRPLMKKWVKIMRKATKYVDPVAGSNNQPFLIASTYGIPVLVNDGSFYSHSIASGLFHRKKETDLELLAEVLVEAKNYCRDGILTELAPANFPPKLTRYVDGLLTIVPKIFKKGDVGFVRACTGKTLMTLCSFRSVAFSLAPKLKGKNPKEQIEELAKTILRNASTANSLFVPGKAYFGDARNFLETADLKGATVSFDPAWPFSKARKAVYNPYNFYRKMGDVLEQKVHEEIPFWTDPDSPKAVANEFASWVGTCFDRGAKAVYAWNQNSNDPSKKRLMKRLEKEFQCKEKLSIVKNRILGNKQFEDYVLEIKPSKT